MTIPTWLRLPFFAHDKGTPKLENSKEFDSIEAFNAWLATLDLPRKERAEMDGMVFVIGKTCNGELPSLLAMMKNFAKKREAKVKADREFEAAKKLVSSVYAKPIRTAGLLAGFGMEELCRAKTL